jgi:hypothetical protein
MFEVCSSLKTIIRHTRKAFTSTIRRGEQKQQALKTQHYFEYRNVLIIDAKDESTANDEAIARAIAEGDGDLLQRRQHKQQRE